MTTTAQHFIQTVEQAETTSVDAQLHHARPFMMLGAAVPQGSDHPDVTAFGFVFPDRSGVISLDTANLRGRLGNWSGFVYSDMSCEEVERLRTHGTSPQTTKSAPRMSEHTRRPPAAQALVANPKCGNPS